MSTVTVEKVVILKFNVSETISKLKFSIQLKICGIIVNCKVEQILSIFEPPSVPLRQTEPLAASAAGWAAGASPASYSALLWKGAGRSLNDEPKISTLTRRPV